MHADHDGARVESAVERPAEIQWDQELALLLAELSAAQVELLNVLGDKRRLLLAGDLAGLAPVQQREAQLAERLERCHQQRKRLLAWAAEDGVPAESLRALSAVVSPTERPQISAQLQAAQARQRLLEHQSLANWVVVQRTLVYLSHVLEIIATGGRSQPTYGKDSPPTQSGNLVDQAA